ncbi:MAG: hypothetical protein IT385_12145 [Deltaproteobacteria bacterium]|nr:hypothetical protein [Deltaproteobacteria bacterium]
MSNRALLALLFIGAGACGGDEAGPADTDAAADTADVETTVAEVEDDTEAEDTEPETEPEDTEVEPETEDTEPERETESEDTEPETEDAEPETADAEPEIEDIEPETGDTEPETGDTEPETADAPDTAPPDTGEPPDPCAAEPPAPLPFVTLEGFTGSEDFAFREQWAYSVDMNGNLVRDTTSGQGQMVLPNLSTFAAGMALLPDGRLAVNDAEQGALVLVSVAASPVTKVTLLGGLSYPNGIDVDHEGFLYIAEQDAGRVRRVDPTSGAFEIIATDLLNPNGVSFAPGFRRLYVGSFGGGVVWALDRRDDGSWTAPVVWLALPGFGLTGPAIDTCKSAAEGDLCFMSDGLGGRCARADGGLACAPDPEGTDPLVALCTRLPVGERCSLQLAGVRYSGTCVDDPFVVDPVCDIEQSIAQPCFHAYAGKACISFENGPPFFGVCTDAQDIPDFLGYPSQGLFCVPPGSGEGGGLDGLNVDACGTVYVTEYILGRVWRKRDGHPVEIAATLPSQWIPNMHWGSGVGGWSTTTLYVADRDLGRMFGLVIGREGKHTVLP